MDIVINVRDHGYCFTNVTEKYFENYWEVNEIWKIIRVGHIETSKKPV
jgi:hypothetical protein